ncbi:MAG: TolC family protein, partial [Pseudomonadales bacterium]
MIRRISLLCAVLFSGCSVGPIYESPALEVADNWSLPSVDTAVAELDVWWESFHDPVLNRLVESARTQNLSVQQAIARVSEARARRDGAVGGRYPSVNAQGQL